MKIRGFHLLILCLLFAFCIGFFIVKFVRCTDKDMNRNDYVEKDKKNKDDRIVNMDMEVNKTHTKKPNKLISEKSPYLLQHAYNPVDWYPWGKEAFDKAQKESKLIFLSIGYSTCHWCHVMEKESFEDEDVAKILNDNYVAIKVDREERPDIDSVYMNICQAITGSGGWPLTIIMTSDKKPVFAGTYLPKKNMFGRPGLIDVLTKISDLWNKDKEKLIDNAEKITEEIKSYLESSKSGEKLDKEILSDAFNKLEKRYDGEYGGFGNAPKFPTPHVLSFLLRYYYRTEGKKALEMVENTLVKMRLGGIYDHIGFGFHRYSTDNRWFAPHFEKMIYDQAMLAIAYTEAYAQTKKEFYKQVVDEIFTYVLRDMTLAEGAFYTAEDADSEGEEGKFYLWTTDEVKKVLGDEHGKSFIETFNLSKEGNFHEYNEKENKRRNILYLVSNNNLPSNIETLRQKLFAVREKRIHPRKDDKVLTDWNGLMIASLSIASRILRNPKYADMASKAVDFILNKMDNKKGGLLHSYREGVAKIDGFLDDYSFFVWGLLELYETTFDVKYLKEAIRLTDYQLKHFWDDKNGGMFITAADGEQHIIKSKEVYDGAIPSGNSIALLNLLKIWHITSDNKYKEKAHNLINAFAKEVKNYSPGFAQFLIGIDFVLNSSYQVIISGKKDSQDTKLFLDALNSKFIPNKIVLFRDDADPNDLISIAPYTKNQKSIEGKTTAYVCKNFVCNLPTNDVKTMLSFLDDVTGKK